jgi:hypothetical protein
MNNFNLGEVLTKAWQIIWKHKVLWIFGILAGCGTNGTRFNFGNNVNYTQSSSQLPPDMQRQLQPFIEFLNNVNWAVVAAVFFGLICVIVLVVALLSTIGRIGLIKGAAQADAGRESLAFGELWSESMPYFWRMFWLNFLAGLPFFLIAIGAAVVAIFSVIAMTGVAQGTGSERVFIGLLPLLGGGALLICCLSLVSIVVQFIVNQAYNAIVIEDRSIIEGFTRGWDVIVKNIGPMLLMAIILLILQWIIGFLIALPLLLIFIPTIAATIFTAYAGNGLVGVPFLFALLCICIYAPVAWVLNGILQSYIQSAWTLTFLRLTVQPQTPVPNQLVDANPSL